MTEPNTTQPTDASGGESLDALAAEAGRLDAMPSEAQQAQAEQQQAQALAIVTNNAGELLAALHMARAMALPILPPVKRETLADIWSDAVLQNVSQAGAAVLERHGVALSSILGSYAPYIALVAAVAPPVLATRAVLARPEPVTEDTPGG